MLQVKTEGVLRPEETQHHCVTPPSCPLESKQQEPITHHLSLCLPLFQLLLDDQRPNTVIRSDALIAVIICFIVYSPLMVLVLSLCISGLRVNGELITAYPQVAPCPSTCVGNRKIWQKEPLEN